MSRPVQLGDFVRFEKGAIYQITKMPSENDPSFHVVNIVKPEDILTIIYDKGWKIPDSNLKFEFINDPWLYPITPKQRNSGGISYPFGPPKIVTDPALILSIVPGEHLQYLDFHFKFYDFANPDHLSFKTFIFNMFSQEVCDWKTSVEYYIESVANVRYMLTITFLPKNFSEESYAGFLMATPKSKTDVYFWLLCARAFTSYNDQGKELKTFSPSFGVLLQCIMSRYLNGLGYKNIYLDALEHNIDYYRKFGYELFGQKEEKYSMGMLNFNPDIFCAKSLEKLMELQDFASKNNNYLFIS